MSHLAYGSGTGSAASCSKISATTLSGTGIKPVVDQLTH